MTNREQYREEIEVYARNNDIASFIKEHNIADPTRIGPWSEIVLFLLWLDEEYVEPVPEHDGCDGCKYDDDREADEDPCRKCKTNYIDRYERA